MQILNTEQSYCLNLPISWVCSLNSVVSKQLLFAEYLII